MQDTVLYTVHSFLLTQQVNKSIVRVGLLKQKSGILRMNKPCVLKVPAVVQLALLKVFTAQVCCRCAFFGSSCVAFCQGLAFYLCVSALMMKRWKQNLLRLRRKTRFARLSPPADSRAFGARGLFLMESVKPSLWQRLLVVYNFIWFRWAESHTHHNHFRCVMVCYHTWTPQKTRSVHVWTNTWCPPNLHEKIFIKWMACGQLNEGWEHAWSSGKVQDSWSLDHQNVVSSSPATASVFVSLGKILNLNLLCWPERIWYQSIVGNITI